MPRLPQQFLMPIVPIVGLLLLACAPAQERPPNVILVSVDSLRADHLGAYGYARDTSPTIDRLAREGVLFETAMSTTSWTLPSHASLFTGLTNHAHGVRSDAERLSDSHDTLAELLARAGYHTAAFYGAPYLHPVFGMAQGFEHYESYNAFDTDRDDFRAATATGRLDSGRQITGPAALAAVERWLSQLDARPYFLFLHLWDVHFDYMPPAEYVAMFETGESHLDASDFDANPAIHSEMPEADLARLVALYDGEIRFNDDVLARVLDAIDAAGRLENTAIVFTADHGEEFFEHGNKGHRKSLYDEVLRVPLVVWFPGRATAGLRVPDQVRLIDVLPTILGIAGVAAPERVQGRDLGPFLRGDSLPPAPAVAELEDLVAIRSDSLKVIKHRGRALVYDLRADPGETRRVAPTREAQRLAAELEAQLERSRAIAAAHETNQPEEPLGDSLRDELRALGYVDEEASKP